MKKTCMITGVGGLIGSECARFFSKKGFNIIGIDNDMRSEFFGSIASTKWNIQKLMKELGSKFNFHDRDVSESSEIASVFRQFYNEKTDIQLVIHAAAQPSHDWPAKSFENAFTDFDVNARGTMNMLQYTKVYFSKAVFIFTSTNKVYGDRPNTLEYQEELTRFEPKSGILFNYGFNEEFSIDQSKHSIFGANKLAADIMVQEFGKYFGMKTGVFRGGCLTGPAHSSAQLHGFLAYLAKSLVDGKRYEIFGYKGKQVRDNIHSFDVANAFWHFFKNPRCGEVYNIGGQRENSCSVLEAINDMQKIAKKKVKKIIRKENRVGDHKWWITDMSKFKEHFPKWQPQYALEDIYKELISSAKKNR